MGYLSTEVMISFTRGKAYGAPKTVGVMSVFGWPYLPDETKAMD